MSTQTALIVGLVLLVANAFFVAAEFAIVSARRSRVELRAAQGSAMARTTITAMQRVSLVMAGAQLGITMASLGLGAVAEPALARLIQPGLHALSVPMGLQHPIAFALALCLVIYLHVVLAEMVPKNLALAGPERAAVLLGPPMMVVVTVLHPLIAVLNAVANGVIRLMRVEPRDEISSTFTREQVEAMVDESHHEGAINEGEYERLSGALGFTSLSVGDVLLPLASLQTVPRGARVTDVEARCAETGFSRFPVVDNQQLVGYLHIKDVLAPDPHGRASVVDDKWIRPFATVPPDASLVSALQTLQSMGAHMARVVDRSGQVIGIVTLEDVIEELVGEIRDGSHTE
jgi:CBS domain containing-hemolysin-like protein